MTCSAPRAALHPRKMWSIRSSQLLREFSDRYHSQLSIHLLCSFAGSNKCNFANRTVSLLTISSPCFGSFFFMLCLRFTSGLQMKLFQHRFGLVSEIHKCHKTTRQAIYSISSTLYHPSELRRSFHHVTSFYKCIC